MASLKNWLGFSKKSVITVDSLNETTREGINKGYIPKFLYKPPFGYPRFANMTYVRYLAQTPYVEMCVSTVIDEIASIEWDIVAEDGMEDQEDEAEKEHIKNFFLNPNTNNESFEEVFIRMPVRDVLEVNSGVLNKVFNMKEELVEVVARDGATFTKNPDVHGMYTDREDIILPNRIIDDTVGQEYLNPYTEITSTSAREKAAYFQYGWIAGPIPVPFGKREIIWIEKMKRSDDHYGYSPVQLLSKSLQMLMYMIESDLEYYNDNNVPKGIIGLDESDADEISAFKEQWFESQRTKDEFGSWKKMMNKVPIVNKTPNFTRIEFSAQEMQVIEKQKWYTKMVWACFGVNATELGYTEDAAGAANQIVQSKVFRKKAINPMLRNLESDYNMSIVSEFNYWGEIKTKAGKIIKKPKYKFKFKKFDVDEEKSKYELYELQTKSGLKTINEVRASEGLEDLEWGDKAPKDWMQAENSWSMPGEPGEPNERSNSDREDDAMNPDEGQEDVEDKGLRGPPEKPTVDPDAEEEEDSDEDGNKKKKESKDFELKYKYIKRTGSSGHYQYWYNDPKTGKLVSGDKPKETNNINDIKESAEIIEDFINEKDINQYKSELKESSDKELYDFAVASDALYRYNKEAKQYYINAIKEIQSRGNDSRIIPEAISENDNDSINSRRKELDNLNKTHLMMYHVTSNDNIKSIQANGLIPGHSKAAAQEFQSKYKAVYFHLDEKVAQRDAKDINGTIISVKIPLTDTNKDLLSKHLHPDEDSSLNAFDSIKETLSGPVAFSDKIDPNMLTIIKKKESKAQEITSPLIIKEGERPTGYNKLEQAIHLVNKQNEEEILKFLDAELGKPTLNEVKGINEIMSKIKSLLGIAILKPITEEIIRNNYLDGWEEAEKDLNRNIIPDQNAIDYMSEYTYDNIKGMNEDIAEKLRQVMQRGFMDGSGKDEIKKEILKVFDVGDNRGSMIAITESNRASNFGRLHGYMKSGMPGKKVYSAHLDGRTSPICKRLDGQVKNLDEDFIDPKGEWKGPVPPAHVNCRSSWTFKVDD